MKTTPFGLKKHLKKSPCQNRPRALQNSLSLRLAGLPAVSKLACGRRPASRLPAGRQGRKVLLRQPGYPGDLQLQIHQGSPLASG